MCTFLHHCTDSLKSFGILPFYTYNSNSFINIPFAGQSLSIIWQLQFVTIKLYSICLVCSNCMDIIVCHHQSKKFWSCRAIIYKQVTTPMCIISYTTLQNGVCYSFLSCEEISHSLKNVNISFNFILINAKMVFEVILSIS